MFVPVVLTSTLAVVVLPWGALVSCDADTLWAVPVVDVCTSPLASSARRINLIKNYLYA